MASKKNVSVSLDDDALDGTPSRLPARQQRAINRNATIRRVSDLHGLRYYHQLNVVGDGGEDAYWYGYERNEHGRDLSASRSLCVAGPWRSEGRAQKWWKMVNGYGDGNGQKEMEIW